MKKLRLFLLPIPLILLMTCPTEYEITHDYAFYVKNQSNRVLYVVADTTATELKPDNISRPDHFDSFVLYPQETHVIDYDKRQFKSDQDFLERCPVTVYFCNNERNSILGKTIVDWDYIMEHGMCIVYEDIE